MPSIKEYIKRIQEKDETLTEIDLSKVNFGSENIDDFEEFIKCLQDLTKKIKQDPAVWPPNLKTIRLDSWMIDESQLILLIKCFSDVIVTNCGILPKEDARASDTYEIFSLNLKGTKTVISTNFLEHILQYSPKLKAFSLEACNADPSLLQIFTEENSKSIKGLNVSGNSKIKGEHIVGLLKKLPQDCKVMVNSDQIKLDDPRLVQSSPVVSTLPGKERRKANSDEKVKPKAFQVSSESTSRESVLSHLKKKTQEMLPVQEPPEKERARSGTFSARSSSYSGASSSMFSAPGFAASESMPMSRVIPPLKFQRPSDTGSATNFIKSRRGSPHDPSPGSGNRSNSSSPSLPDNDTDVPPSTPVSRSPSRSPK